VQSTPFPPRFIHDCPDNGGAGGAGDIGGAGFPMPTGPPSSDPPPVDPFPPVGASSVAPPQNTPSNPVTPPQNTPSNPRGTSTPTDVPTSDSSYVVSSQVSILSSSSSVHPSTTPSTPHSDPSSYKPTATQSPVVSTHAVAPSGTNSSAVPGAQSASASASGSTNSHPVAAGVVVGLIALGALVCVVVFAIRRYRRNHDDHFDANDFRRSAFLINDPPAHADTAAQGFNPRPPTMIERRLGNSPVVPGVPYGDVYSAAAADHYNVSTFSASDSNSHTQEFPGGQMMNPFASPPPSPRSFAPSYATAGHSQPSLRTSAVLNAPQPPLPLAIKRPSRPASGNAPGAANGFTFPRRNAARQNTLDRQQEEISAVSDSPPANDYVDLNRSSVSPFQAAQYEAISRQLSTENSHSFDYADTDAAMEEFTDEPPPVPPKTPFDQVEPAVASPSTESTDSAPPVPAKSPFEDPEPERKAESQTAMRPATPELRDFPVPPSPVPTVVSRYRVDSISSTSPNTRNPDSHNCRPPTPTRKNVGNKCQPSPLAACSTNVDKDGLETEKNSGENTQPPTSATATSSSVEASKVRPDTVYDLGDAYGGI